MLDARTIALGLGGKWYGRNGSAPCPVRQPERRIDQRALDSRSEGGRTLILCFKSCCDFRALILAADLRRRVAELERKVAALMASLATARPSADRTPMRDILGDVALRYRVTVSDILVREKRRQIILARAKVQFVARRSVRSLQQIANDFECDHTSVLHNVQAEAQRRDKQ